jgi:elongator complex protein 1
MPTDEPECISFRYLAEDRALCVITSGGDIALFKLEGDDFEVGDYENSSVQVSTVFEPYGAARIDKPWIQGYTVGTIESGIKAASWSPDEEQVILITGKNADFSNVLDQ